MDQLSGDERVRIIACLVEGNSISATCRLTGAADGTITKLLEQAGAAALEYQDRELR